MKSYLAIILVLALLMPSLEVKLMQYATKANQGVTSTSSPHVPNCGLVSDTTTHVPNATTWAAFTPPAVGSTYTDSGYCAVTRVTNFVGNSTNSGCHYYATENPMDESDSMLMLYDCNTGGWFVDAGPENGLYSVGTAILTESDMSAIRTTWTEPTWDRNSADVFWITTGHSISKCTVNNSAKSVSCAVNHAFSEYASGQVSFMDETDMTPDGWLVVVGSNSNSAGPIDIFLWNPTTATKSSVYTTTCTDTINKASGTCVHKLIATPNDGIVIQFEGNGSLNVHEDGNQLWETPFSGLSPVELNSGGTGPGGSGGTDHLDTGKTSGGVETAAYEDFQNNPGPWGGCGDPFRPTSTTLPLSGNPSCVFNNRPNEPGWHVSFRGWPATEFVTYSAQAYSLNTAEYFNNSASYVAPSSSNWTIYDNEIVEVLIGSNNNSADIYRLALAHTRNNGETSTNFWWDPRAAESYDGRYVIFDSNSAWTATGCGTDGGGVCSDVYLIGPLW